MDPKINITPAPGVSELIIKTGEHENPPYPVPVEIEGYLSAPASFLKAKEHLLNKDICHVVVNHNAGTITFVDNERDSFTNRITGKLKPAKDLSPFNINGTNKFEPMVLYKIMRKHPFLFEKESDRLNMMDQLINFQATITTAINNKDDKQGNIKQSFEQAVKQKVMQKITFKGPLYEGADEVIFQAEVCCDATSAGVEFYFESAELFILEKTEKLRLLTEQIAAFDTFGCAIINQ